MNRHTWIDKYKKPDGVYMPVRDSKMSQEEINDYLADLTRRLNAMEGETRRYMQGTWEQNHIQDLLNDINSNPRRFE